MIIAKIKQSGQVITLEDALKTFRYSANLQMQFIKDNRYKDYTLVGFYKPFKNNERLLSIDEDGIFTLGADVFKENGTVYFSFSLNSLAGEIIHLGVIEYTVEQSFGNSDAILPENEDTWIQVVSRVVEDQVSDIWDKDYKPQLEENLNIIETKTEEIKTSAAEVKQDALESSVNAKSALDSANLAQSSANTALEAEEKALEHSTNAEQFKNDAFSYANQANLAKTEAQQSATDAGNSASNALTNANKAQQHLNSIVEKTNAFNVDYASKVEDFNTNVESANTALNNKISTANTDMDKKVLDANTSLDKKITDANGVMDTKVTEATAQANIATSKATELKDAVDKVKYLEDVVDTKLTQPYVSSDLIENATISDSDEGMLRNLRIYGKCTQNIEENIVPTPNRPIPITSKKVSVDNEVVELRSLKESVNLWDAGLMPDTEGNDIVTSRWAYVIGYVEEFLPWLKPNTRYTAKCTMEKLQDADPSFSVASLQKAITLYRNNHATLPNVYTHFFISAEIIQEGNSIIVQNTFTTPPDLTDVTILYYSERHLDLDNKGYSSKVAFRNIMLVEGTTLPSTYVAPTVRDYKIVDHVNKKSWIERNVVVENLSNYTQWSWDNNGFAYIIRKNLTKNSASISNYFNAYKFDGYKDGITININKCICIKDSSFPSVADVTSFLRDKEVLCYAQLETPTTEEIEYLESDISEIGVSSQDSTSPSLSIKSPIETVKVLNIKVCGKNLFDVSKANEFKDGVLTSANNAANKEYTCVIITNVFDYAYKNNQKLTISFDLKTVKQGDVKVYSLGQRRLSEVKIIQADNEYKRYSATFSLSLDQSEVNGEDCKLSFYGTYGTGVIPYVKNIQIEVGDTTTDYEPYKETSISHELENPLLSLADGSVKDIITLENRLNLLSIYTFTGTETFAGDYTQSGYYGRCYNALNARGDIAQKVSCNVLSHVPSSWSLAQEGCCQNANQLHLKFSNLRLGIRDDTPIVQKRVAFSNYIKEQYDNGTPIEFLYILENPTTEPLEPELIEKLKTLMSFYPVTHIISNVPISFDRKLNLENWHKVVSGQVEDARNIIYNLTVKQNSLEVMQLESSLNMQYNMDLLKLQGGI